MDGDIPNEHLVSCKMVLLLFVLLSMLVIMVMLMALMMAGDKPNEHLVSCKMVLNFLMGNQIPQAECNKQNLSHETGCDKQNQSG